MRRSLLIIILGCIDVIVCLSVCLSSSVFESAGVDLSKPLLVTCGGAVVAPFLAFSLFQLGINAPVYDVSELYWEI